MIIYGLIIRLFAFAIWLASFYSQKSKHWIEGRKHWKRALSAICFENDKWIWFHCSSFGEFNDGKTLIEAVKTRFPHSKILLTFFSPSGYEIRKNYKYADEVLYLPLDTQHNAKYFVDKINPSVVFFVRGDIWPNYLMEISKRKIPVFLHSFTLSYNSSFLKFPQNLFYRNLFNLFTAIFVHNESSEKILKTHKFSEKVFTSGNARIDTVLENPLENFSDEIIQNFVGNSFCVIAGSTHSKDKQIFLKTFTTLSAENIKWIIVPHEINKTEIAEAQNVFGDKMILFSEVEKINEKTKLLWVDTVGLLAKIYRYADVVLIGGGFRKIGIHSILEPAVYGCPVCFGPKHRNYTEAIEMLASGCAEIIYNENDFQNFNLKYKKDNELLNKVRVLNKEYIKKNSGATEKVLKFLEEKKIMM